MSSVCDARICVLVPALSIDVKLKPRSRLSSVCIPNFQCDASYVISRGGVLYQLRHLHNRTLGFPVNALFIHGIRPDILR